MVRRSAGEPHLSYRIPHTHRLSHLLQHVQPFSSHKDEHRAAALEAQAASALPAASSAASASPGPTPPELGKNEQFLIYNFNGVLRAGEVALVLGRPGSGCTTFLKTIANQRDGWAGIHGDVVYSDMDADEAGKVSFTTTIVPADD